jgi:hypothetical protein
LVSNVGDGGNAAGMPIARGGIHDLHCFFGRSPLATQADELFRLLRRVAENAYTDRRSPVFGRGPSAASTSPQKSMAAAAATQKIRIAASGSVFILRPRRGFMVTHAIVKPVLMPLRVRIFQANTRRPLGRPSIEIRSSESMRCSLWS